MVVCHRERVGVDQHIVEEGFVSWERRLSLTSVVNVAPCCGRDERQFVRADPDHGAISLVGAVGEVVEGSSKLSQCDWDGRQSP